MKKQNYKQFLESAEYKEEETEKEVIRKTDFKSIAIMLLALFLIVITGSHIWARECFDKVVSYKDEEIAELKEKAFDDNGREWQERYSQLETQYSRSLEHMQALGYDMSFQYVGEGAE